MLIIITKTPHGRRNTHTQNHNNIFVNSPQRTKMRALRHAESTYTHNKYDEAYTHTHTHTHTHRHTHTQTQTQKTNDTFLKSTQQKHMHKHIHTDIHT